MRFVGRALVTTILTGHVMRPQWAEADMRSETVSATEFKAKCLDLLDQVGARHIGRLETTKHGKVVAVLSPPPSREEAVQQLHGFLRGSVLVPKGLDLTAPALDDPLNAELGRWHERSAHPRACCWIHAR